MSQGTGGVQRSVPQSGAGQRSTSTLPQQFYISTSQQAPVMISCSGNGGTPVITSSAFHSTGVPTVSVIQQPTPSADLYLCNTANNATGEVLCMQTQGEVCETGYHQVRCVRQAITR